MGLHVTHDEGRDGRDIFNAVGEFFQHVRRCLGMCNAMAGIAKVREYRTVRTTFQISAGKRGFDVGYGKRLQTCEDIVRCGLR